MIIEMNVFKGNFEKGTNENGEILYRCNFLTDEDEPIRLFLNEEEVKPFLPLKKFDPCKIKVKLYKSEKGKYGLTGGF